jgi:flagellar hook-associated protein 2
VAGSISTSTSNNPLIPTFNIGGLASGLDTNSIVQSLMQIEQVPQQRIINQQTLETTRQSDLQAIRAQLTTFSGSLATLVSPSTWTTGQTITSSDPAHVTATGAGVPPGGFDISVSQIARAQQLTQSTSLAAANADDTLTIQVGSAAAFNVSVKSGDSLATIAGAINQASNTQVYASVVNSKLVLSSQVTAAASRRARAT